MRSHTARAAALLFFAAMGGGAVASIPAPPSPTPRSESSRPETKPPPASEKAALFALPPGAPPRRDGWRHPGRGRIPEPLPTAKTPPERAERILLMQATGYTPGPESCGASADGITATGHRAGPGIVAVDPRVIPMGALLYVEGYGYAWALDVGGAIRGNRVDLCFDSVPQAMRWGRRDVRVHLVSSATLPSSPQGR